MRVPAAISLLTSSSPKQHPLNPPTRVCTWPRDRCSKDPQNALTSAELNRRRIAAIEQALQHGLVYLLKRNRSAAVVLSEQHYRQLQLQASRAPGAAASALQWLLTLPPSTSPRRKAEIDADLAAERDW
jgi:PHD/YefM family antitoxin component YafN of YafNO toxin-antitoxin module